MHNERSGSQWMVMEASVKALLLCLWSACAAQEKILFSVFEGGASVFFSYIYLLEIEMGLPT